MLQYDNNLSGSRGNFIFNTIKSNNAESALGVIVNQRTVYQDKPLAIIDLQEVKKLYQLWREELPNSIPYYAVKCNPDTGIISTLIKLGGGFDCASLNEMKLVLELGAHPSKIIFAHPCKLVSHLEFARKHGVKKLTVDNLDELDKIKNYHPSAELVIRIETDDKDSLVPLSSKFGVPIKYAEEILARAKSLDLLVIGVSFHVGCNCSDPNAYRLAISEARSIFDIAKNSYGYQCHFLDIGGGFFNSKSHPDSMKFQTLSKVIRSSFAEYFHDFPNLEIIGEPGQFLEASSMSLATQIMARRLFRSSQSEVANMYYINDGTHGTLNRIVYSGVPHYKIYRNSNNKLSEINPSITTENYPSCVWGPTCNSMDKVIPCEELPILEIGDWIVFDYVGAYRSSTGSEFNGFE